MNRHLLSVGAAFASAAIALAGCSATQGEVVVAQNRETVAQNRETLYQVSLLQDLTEGDFEGSVTVGDLKQYGDTGIGTFDGLDGELVMLDGEVWQAAGDGSVNLMDDAATIPFGNVTFLDSDETLDVSGVESFDDLLALLNGRVEELGPNNFYAVRIDGTFAEMHVRSEYKQEEPYPTIVEALEADQTFFDLENVEGSMVGVYCPPYVSSMNNVGWHFHFVTADRSQGGHVLGCVVDEATATIDLTKGYYLVLPGSQRFESTDFTVDRSDDIRQAETNDD